MKKNFSILLVFCLFGVVFGQGRFVKINTDAQDSSVISIAQVSEKSEITGNIKQTTVELIITNSSSRILEGELEFPLEEGESVTGFALDIDGKMRQAVAIEKDKGRQVFEDIVRRGVDPGLVEKTSGNNFKTRVYPIPANGFRRFQLTYEKELSASDTEIVKDKVFTQTIGKDTYFYYLPDLSSVKMQAKERKLPESITIYFDISSSAANRDLNKEYEFLKKYFEKCKVQKIDCVTFSNKIDEKKSFDNAEDLISFLKNQNFDGGTNLNLEFSKCKNSEILLFTDGIHNFGSVENSDSLNKKSKNQRIVAVNSSKSADFAKLKSISDDFINLLNQNTESAVNQITHDSLKLISVDYDKSEVSEIFPLAGEICTENFSVAGILNKKNSKIALNFGYGSEILKTVHVELSSVENESSVQAENVGRIWAKKKIENLGGNSDSNKDEITKLAKKFTIVTDYTSLIVLDSVQDYVRYGINPPQELQDEYNRLTKNQSTLQKNEKSGIPESVYRNFEEYKKWWNTKAKDFKKKKRDRSRILHTEMAEAENFEVTADSVMSNDLPEMEAAPLMARSASTLRMDDGAFAEESLMTASAAEEFGAENSNILSATVVLQSWNSNAEYISELKKTATDKMYKKYLEIKKDYEKSPAFYMEVSDYFYEEGLKDEGLKILSNLAELNLENSDILRALGNKLQEKGENQLAISVFEKLTKIRPEVPQFYRDLGLAYLQAEDYQNAADAFWKVVSGQWDARYNEIQQTVLNELNSMIELHENQIDCSKYDDDLLENFDVDIRIVLTWNTDDCDVDLWVTDPDGEKCFYGNRLTQNGGRISRDFTQGYGPEEFAIKKAVKGKYKIQANYYGNHQQKILQPVIVQAEVFTNFGRKNQKKQVLTLQLDDIKQTFDIGEIEF